ncbi:MAG: SDR family NAD(P)-dependent oxidoreductase [Actinomycetota bacterium]
MRNHQQRTAVVTGATSGLGYEAARQLVDRGWGQVVVTGRTTARAKEAAARVADETGRGVVAPLELDLNRSDSVAAAADELVRRGTPIDFLLLNAGMVSGNTRRMTDEGVEITFASSLIGHHQLTMRLVEAGLLADDARIVIAGSEAARGDLPTFNVTDLEQFAAKHHGGDRVRAAEALIRSDDTVKYKASHAYSDTKMFVAWWSQELARKLPSGMAVFTVSPGSAPDTDAARNATGVMKYVMLPMFKLLPGKSMSVDVAAKRYLDAADYGTESSGAFYASKPKKVIGPVEIMRHPHLHDRTNQAAAWEAVVKVAGGVDYPVNA